MSNFKVSLTQAVPDTGLFTNTDNSSGVAIGAGAIILLFAAIAIAWAMVIKHRNHRNYQSSKFRLRASKRTIMGLSALAVLIGVSSIAISRQADDAKPVSAAEDPTAVVDTTAGGDGEDDDTLSISVSDLELSVVPTEDGTFAYTYQTVKVGVPTNAGYILRAYASSENLINAENEESAISGMENSMGANTLGVNTWGMSLEEPEDATSKVWSKMPSTPESATVVNYTRTATQKDDTTKVYYGVNVNTDLAYGDYTNTIIYTAVANEVSIDSLYYMQDFNILSEEEKGMVFDSMQTGEQFQLVDSRDSNQYSIAKLADGNIWMTQNLDLDLDSTRTYTPADTDISDNWKPSSSTIEFPGTIINGWASSTTAPDSADPGEVYYYISNNSNSNEKYTSLDDCTAAGHTSTECSHYHAGNYYNWPAAIASNDASSLTTLNTDAPSSICPAGWRLPTVSEDSESTAGSTNEFARLNYLYNEGSISTNAGFISAPLWFTQAGVVIPATNNSASTSETSATGAYWSSTVAGEDIAFYLKLANTSVMPHSGYYNYKSYGRSIRCVLR